ncbi:TPA: hypothetical protein J1049_001576 [Escherichia coli]|nr:hypothetical protein [Escherichia coli]EKH3759835.1 hypothetical protein [Escherichia coli]EKH4086834.1 hypothetical protein [Escherichia coli]ELB9838132.1 hypothetical protein [Escherichia coli]ELB9862997.1 hypothetical protein [Escherichia coli]
MQLNFNIVPVQQSHNNLCKLSCSDEQLKDDIEFIWSICGEANMSTTLRWTYRNLKETSPHKTKPAFAGLLYSLKMWSHRGQNKIKSLKINQLNKRKRPQSGLFPFFTIHQHLEYWVILTGIPP